jgi:hypothetical protein
MRGYTGDMEPQSSSVQRAVPWDGRQDALAWLVEALLGPST